ncbi:MAG: nucleoside triphosphate pyrophosphohydrolase [Chitinophagia bacterium]|nr:nucleoside triphosphate pyrophosphohydrolase [Chitinophagia bacterium]
MENHIYAGSLQRLLTIMTQLRAQCPWDKKQTLQTLRPQTIEELYELADAVQAEDWANIKEELGDMLLHIVFYTTIAKEQAQFVIEDVIAGICNKLVSRHPHIYGSVNVKDEEEVKQNWEKLKMKEGKTSILSGVPKAMPALGKALLLQRKTQKVGFEWDNTAQVKAKVEEEWQELDEAIKGGNKHDIEDELGDVLFALVNYARFVDIDPEVALERSNQKFMRRFKRIETLAAEQGNSLQNMNLEAMDKLWHIAKQEERSK